MILYKIISKNDTREFEKEVEEYLNNGWKLAGGVSISNHYIHYQALYKEELEK